MSIDIKLSRSVNNPSAFRFCVYLESGQNQTSEFDDVMEAYVYGVLG